MSEQASPSPPPRLLPLDGPIEHHDALDSTMSRARALLREKGSACQPGTSIVAATQHAGRGRHGRTWLSLPHAGLFVTVLVPLPHLQAASGLSLVAGYAALEAAQKLVPAAAAGRVQLKWPNDVIVGSDKLAGLLVELEHSATGAPWALVGLGLNILPCRELPRDEARHDGRYIGLVDLMPGRKTADKGPLAAQALTLFRAQLSGHLGVLYTRGFAALSDPICRHHALVGTEVRAQYQGRTVEGRAEGLGPKGELMLRTGETLLALIAGEVEKIRPAR